MEYSTDDVAAARSLQFATYIYTSMAAFWTYDYACSLHEEWTFLLRSHWSKMKGLYIVIKYLPFILLITDLYMSFTSNENPVKCGMLANISAGLGMLLSVCSECFFILRTYALWDRNRILLAAILGTFFVSFQSTRQTQASGRSISQSFLAASISITVDTTVSAAYATSPIPGITGCYQSSTSDRIFIPFLLFSVFGLGLMILTLIRAIQSWRRHPSRLYVVLVNHNIFYYVCAFLFSVMNMFTSLLLQDTYRTVLNGFQFLTLAIVAVRMHIHLWQTNQHLVRGSSGLVHIPLSDISFANVTA
ncbi:uncharacterized protein F5891DRAFT_390531 [Suillus fuscotomentosus]|uniref:DUF6533 domain-containing protein n=1 Tax=Suillus fuscotomentosus TaxID=1912939 RepID=A0AAD4HKM5_9AGAM|nr:uncharacterized protein F5891DRAFT_390531 [Suillus fuscotomentosus]KAG1899651.1 hypothetical protein F5891DRAFT_390531 [Suillus fuscotomentosus]